VRAVLIDNLYNDEYAQQILFYDGHYEASLPNQGIEGAASDFQVSGGPQYCFAG